MNASVQSGGKLFLYDWQGIDALGQLQTGAMLAKEETVVHQHLFALSLQPIAVKAKLHLGPRYWKNADLIAFIRQLATLLQAGLPLANSLN